MKTFLLFPIIIRVNRTQRFNKVKTFLKFVDMKETKTALQQAYIGER